MTFDQARVAAFAAARALWPNPAGTLMAAQWGWEDSESWRVAIGFREDLVDGDPDYRMMDPPIWLVSKATGEVTMTTYLADLERWDAMTMVGTYVPPTPPPARSPLQDDLDTTFAETRRD